MRFTSKLKPQKVHTVRIVFLINFVIKYNVVVNLFNYLMPAIIKRVEIKLSNFNNDFFPNIGYFK